MKKYAVWKDETYGFDYGDRIRAGTKEIVHDCDTYDEAKALWIWEYYYNH